MQASVSVIIPVRNGAEFIGDAIESALSQSAPPSDIVVIDDGSTDRTADEVRKFREVSYVHQPASGQAEARNHGARLAQSHCIAFLDADDLWTPRKLELQLNVFRSRPDIEVVSGRMVQFKTGDDGSIELLSKPAPANLPGTMLIKRETFRRVGPFSSRWKVGETIDWWSRAIDCGVTQLAVDDVVLMRRVHKANLGKTTTDPMKDVLGVLHATLARRRAQKS